jgi:polyhydroxyalkanoate synthesis regulator phasin
MTKRKQVVVVSLTLASLAVLALAPIASAHEGLKGEGYKPGKHIEQRMRKRAYKIDNRLDKLVKEGKITKQQKQAIVDKLKENAQKRKNIHKIKDIHRRKEAIKQLHEDMRKWLQEQGIDIEILKLNKQQEL